MPGNFKTIPASVIASWPEPNYVDPVRRTYMPAFALTWQLTSTLLLSGRLYLRARGQAGGFGLDDVMICIGWLFSVGFTATALLNAEKYGLDRHTWDVQPKLFTGTAVVGWTAQLLFTCSTVPTKLSVLLFYRRMVKDALDKRWLYAIYSALFITAGYGLAIFITYFFTCQPLDALWKAYDLSYDKEYQCINGNAFSITVGVCSGLSDIYAVALPCLILRHYELEVPKRQKVALNMIFALGFLVAGAGVGRTIYLWRLNHNDDTSWNGFDLFLWSIVECQLAIIIACTPSLRAFFRHYLRGPLKRTSNTRSSISYYGAGSKATEETAGFSVLSEGRESRTKDLEDGRTGPREDGFLPTALSTRENQADAESWETFVNTTETASSHEGRRTTSPEEYELYAVERLQRHGSMISKVTLDFDTVRKAR